MAELSSLIHGMTAIRASDLHVKVGQKPLYRVSGVLRSHDGVESLTQEDLHQFAKDMLSSDQYEHFVKTRDEVDLAHAVQLKDGTTMRVRVNLFWQRGSIEMVMRHILDQVPSFDALMLPPILQKISLTPRGLILVTGTVGSGKSTTIASMIRFINENRQCHIVSIEDPIEFFHNDIKSSITQREIGIDTASYTQALRAALRQDPDVMFIGEMRDMDTVTTAIRAAETGHLVMSTLHTIDAVQKIDRIIDFFPPTQQNQIRNQLSGTIEAVISQRLVPKKDGTGRVAGIEIMVGTPTIRGYIREGKIREIRTQIQTGGSSYGMQTFDQSLVAHCKAGLISLEDALAEASSPNDVKLQISGIVASGQSARSIIQQ